MAIGHILQFFSRGLGPLKRLNNHSRTACWVSMLKNGMQIVVTDDDTVYRVSHQLVLCFFDAFVQFRFLRDDYDASANPVATISRADAYQVEVTWKFSALIVLSYVGRVWILDHCVDCSQKLSGTIVSPCNPTLM